MHFDQVNMLDPALVPGAGADFEWTSTPSVGTRRAWQVSSNGLVFDYPALPFPDGGFDAAYFRCVH
jgi:hypothetical protein